MQNRFVMTGVPLAARRTPDGEAALKEANAELANFNAAV